MVDRSVIRNMFTAHSKIKKEAGKKADELEEQVAQALFDLEVNTTDLKADLKGLYITAAKEVRLCGRRWWEWWWAISDSNGAQQRNG